MSVERFGKVLCWFGPLKAPEQEKGLLFKVSLFVRDWIIENILDFPSVQT